MAPLRFFQVVRRQDNGDALTLKVREHLVNALAALRVYADRRLVEQHQRGPMQKAARDVQSPLHAAGEPFDGLFRSIREVGPLECPVNTLSEVAAPVGRVVAILVGEPVRPIEALISPGGELAACGLLQLHEANDVIAGGGGRFTVSWRIDSCLDHHFADFPALRDAFLGTPLEPSLNLSDYEHVSDDLDLVTRVIEGASLEKAHGVNILLFGPPGTGKTELAKLAAAAAGVTLYAAGEEQVAGREISRSERLTDLAVFQRLLAGNDGTAILFDEFEDVAWQLINRGGSKIYLNRLLETNPVPVIWTSNNIFEIDAAVLGVSPDGAESHRAFSAKFDLPFTLLSDPDKEMMATYGAWGEKVSNGEKKVGVIRSTVWIGPDGKVKKHWAKVSDAAAHPEEVLAALRS